VDSNLIFHHDGLALGKLHLCNVVAGLHMSEEVSWVTSVSSFSSISSLGWVGFGVFVHPISNIFCVHEVRLIYISLVGAGSWIGVLCVCWIMLLSSHFWEELVFCV